MTEALIGACFLAFGFERTAAAVVAAFEAQIEHAAETPVDFKSALQELLAQRAGTRKLRGDRRIRARRTRAPSRSRRSSTPSGSATGAGRSKKAAEQVAAEQALEQLGRRWDRRRVRLRREPYGWRGQSMYLRSIEMKGFKSFPERARLEFSPGVSVIVGPNGSGKSNITDAVLWALGEQSPGAIRGASMQDVISAGGKGVGQRRAAEVEVVDRQLRGAGRDRALRDRDPAHASTAPATASTG